MIITMLYKRSTLLSIAYCVFGSVSVIAQSKLNEKYTVANDVVVNLNASHTDVVFETWNQNTVEITAFLEGDDSPIEDRLQLLEHWQLSTTAHKNEITINSAANTVTEVPVTANMPTYIDAEQLKMLMPMITDMLQPIMKNIAAHPMPNALQGVQQTNVSLLSNQKEEKYVQQWEKQIQEKFGKSKTQVAKDWSKQLDQNTILLNDLITMSIQTQGGNEAWRQQFGKDMEAWASQFAKEVTAVSNQGNITVYKLQKHRTSNNVHKTIKIKMPKGASVSLNMRHGTVQLAERSTNVRGSLSHTKLSANIIDGRKTYIKASYAPIFIKEWNDGRLVINYVKNCTIKKASNLLANVDSSSIYIQQLDQNGAISGDFGAVTIANLGTSFSALDMALKNSDVKVDIPDSAFHINYNGVHSRIVLPKSVFVNVRKNFGNVFINGYQKTRDTESVITVNAKYSDIVMQ